MKVYVDVTARFDESGGIIPLELRWKDGRTFDIDKVLDVRPLASMKAGGCGVRYKCRICGQERDLFLEDGRRWFLDFNV